jgi:hypothetical protein
VTSAPLERKDLMNFARLFPIRAFSSAGAGAAGLGLILALGSSGGATPNDPARMLVVHQPAVRPSTRVMPPSRRPRVTPSCGAAASGSNAFDSTWDFMTNKSNFTDFGASNLAAAGYAGVFEGSGNVICDYNSVIVGGNANTIDSGAGNTPAGASYSMIGAGLNNSVSSFDSFLGAGLENVLSGTVSFIGAGHNNTVSGHLSFAGAGYGNVVSGPGSFIGAGGDVTAALPNNQISGSDSFIGAGDINIIAANQAFIGGGGANGILAPAEYGAIAGGYDNSISGLAASVGGGESNTAFGQYATVAGGQHNVASGAESAVIGGSFSSATGRYATIAGGFDNAANGLGSFAAGTQAKARNNGAFVWSDNSSTTPLQSSASFQFVARASGGFFFFTNAGDKAGAELPKNSGAWASLSDRHMKTDVVALDDAAVLAKVSALPVSEWSYTSERGVRHVGPMAQDFYAAFRVGEDDRHITSIDEDGVALAAIKALHGENSRLREQLAAVRARDDMRFAAIEKKVAALTAARAGMRRDE